MWLNLKSIVFGKIPIYLGLENIELPSVEWILVWSFVWNTLYQEAVAFVKYPALVLLLFLTTLDFIAGSWRVYKNPGEDWSGSVARTKTSGKLIVWFFWLLVAYAFRMAGIPWAAIPLETIMYLVEGGSIIKNASLASDSSLIQKLGSGLSRQIEAKSEKLAGVQNLMQINKIYLHWSGTSYGWKEIGKYHTIVDDKGETFRLTNYKTPLNGHTFGRNQNSVAVCMACMGGTPWRDFPPTPKQIDRFCCEVAKIAKGLGWRADPNFLEYRIMTHAEAAANRDFPRPLVAKFSGVRPSQNFDRVAIAAGLPHANYGPTSWHDKWPGGDAVRWDLWQLTSSDAGGTGGYQLREKIAAWMLKL